MVNVNLEEKIVTMSIEEYFRLKKDSIKLNFLECGGVDNWEGYGESLYPDYEDEEFDDALCSLKNQLKIKE